jgi:hypothetical protein
MRNHILLFITLLSLSGCGAAPLDGPETSVPQETPAPVPTSPLETATSTEQFNNLPPGISRDGTVNTTQLRRAHNRSLGNQSYRWTFDYVRLGSPEVDPIFNRNVSRSVNVDETRTLVKQTNNLDGTVLSVYVNSSTGYVRTEGANETRLRTIESPNNEAEYVDAGTLIERFLNLTDLDITQVARDGKTYYRIQSGKRAPQAVGGTRAPRDSITAYITPEGFVRSLTVRYDRDAGDGFQSIFLRFDYLNVNKTHVDPPKWVPAVSSTPMSTAPEPDSGR